MMRYVRELRRGREMIQSGDVLIDAPKKRVMGVSNDLPE